MRFSVVVPTYNRKHTLRQTLSALTQQDYADYEIIVVTDTYEHADRLEFYERVSRLAASLPDRERTVAFAEQV